MIKLNPGKKSFGENYNEVNLANKEKEVYNTKFINVSTV